MAARLTSYLVVGIVAVTLIAGLIVRAQRDDSDGPVDLIVHNAVVFTGVASQKTAEALAVRANQILQVGSNREILRLQRPQTLIIDAKGAAVLPGFNDAHVHLIEGGLALDDVDLWGAATVEEALARVGRWIESHPGDGWVTGRGWAFAGEIELTRQSLDELTPDRPAMLLSEDGTTAWVNSRALKLAKIGRRTEDPARGRIVRDKKGEPSGVLEGPAVQLVAAHLPKPSRQERIRALRSALAEAQRLGITSLQTVSTNPADLEMIDALHRESPIEMRLYNVLEVREAREDAHVAALDPVLTRYADDPLMKSGAASVPLEEGRDEVNRLVRLLDARGWQIALEADEPEDVEQAQGAFAHAERSNATIARERRHRLEQQDDVFTDVGRSTRSGQGRTRAIGRDWPRGPLAPMRVLQKAVAYHALSDALRAYTFGSAYASFDEKRKGTLQPGMLADLVVLSANIFKMEPSALHTVKVEYTIFDGRVVHPADRRAPTFP